MDVTEAIEGSEVVKEEACEGKVASEVVVLVAEEACPDRSQV